MRRDELFAEAVDGELSADWPQLARSIGCIHRPAATELPEPMGNEQETTLGYSDHDNAVSPPVPVLRVVREGKRICQKLRERELGDGEEVHVGRGGPPSELLLDDRRVSRTHALFHTLLGIVELTGDLTVTFFGHLYWGALIYLAHGTRRGTPECTLGSVP